VADSGIDDATRAFGPAGANEHTTPITGGLRAAPETTMRIPEPTILPVVFAAGLAVFVVGLLVQALVVGVAGLALGLLGLAWWVWRIGEH
jgi:Flp pilus assembly protein TadB